jgi:hypothetical protein
MVRFLLLCTTLEPRRLRREQHTNIRKRVPPGVKTPPPDLSALPAPLAEYIQKFSEVKKRQLADRDYWYLNFLGRHPGRQELGV